MSSEVKIKELEYEFSAPEYPKRETAEAFEAGYQKPEAKKEEGEKQKESNASEAAIQNSVKIVKLLECLAAETKNKVTFNQLKAVFRTSFSSAPKDIPAVKYALARVIAFLRFEK